LFAGGLQCEVLHYNESTWKSYRSITALDFENHYAVVISGDMVIYVGDN